MNIHLSPVLGQQYEVLIHEHALLRQCSNDLEKTIGPQSGIGWDDCVNFDLNRYHLALERFTSLLKEHERHEDSFMELMNVKSTDRREIFKEEIEKSHESLNGLTQILNTLCSLCDGSHVYALRRMTRQLEQELEIHLLYEEKVLFPLIAKAV